jgi:2-keto-4-pentenoate hydratase
MTEDPRIAAGMARQQALLREHLSDGDVQAGWKLGFGSPSGLALFSLEAPLLGFLLSSAERPNGSAVDTSDWRQPVVEPELAVRLGRDLPAGADTAEVIACVRDLVPALELADVDTPPADVAEILAGDIFQRRFILGVENDRGWGSGPAALRGIVQHGSAETVVTDMEALTGGFLSNLAHAASVAARFGRGLRAGDIVLMGSVIPPAPLHGGDRVTFTVEGQPPVSVEVASPAP